MLGSVDFTLAQVWHGLNGGGAAAEIVRELRLPRAMSAFACGGLLAVAGVLLQVLLRNPLADPYILGVSGGAAVGALSIMLLGLPFAAVNGGALAGALAVAGAVFGLGLAGGWNIYRLLLTGVMLSAGCGALVSLLLTLAQGAEVRGMLFWLMGDLSHAAHAVPLWGVLLATLAIGLAMAASLDVLSVGERKARSLGVAVRPLQIGVFVVASAATAAAVLEAGAIGFVGLTVPHFLRLLGVNDHRWLLPSASLLGGGFLVLADTLARTVAAPQQFPVGVVTALIGVPVMLFLLARRR
jgi:iron complex transport system permease protein